MHILVIVIKMGDMFILIVIMMGYNNFSKGIVFLILVFLLKVTTGLSAGGGTRTLIHHMWVLLSSIKILG
jgi:hypothetical protein